LIQGATPHDKRWELRVLAAQRHTTCRTLFSAVLLHACLYTTPTPSPAAPHLAYTADFLARRLHVYSVCQGRLPPPQAASQLSQAELEELLAENAKLKQLISTVKDRLPPEKVSDMVFFGLS
jgi:hypothetical protein